LRAEPQRLHLKPKLGDDSVEFELIAQSTTDLGAGVGHGKHENLVVDVRVLQQQRVGTERRRQHVQPGGVSIRAWSGRTLRDLAVDLRNGRLALAASIYPNARSTLSGESSSRASRASSVYGASLSLKKAVRNSSAGSGERSPSARSMAARCEPMKPAAPVTR
jgi:hypothetical protein